SCRSMRILTHRPRPGSDARPHDPGLPSGRRPGGQSGRGHRAARAGRRGAPGGPAAVALEVQGRPVRARPGGDPGALASNVLITNPITGSGTINANGAHLSVSGTNGRVTIGPH